MMLASQNCTTAANTCFISLFRGGTVIPRRGEASPFPPRHFFGRTAFVASDELAGLYPTGGRTGRTALREPSALSFYRT